MDRKRTPPVTHTPKDFKNRPPFYMYNGWLGFSWGRWFQLVGLGTRAAVDSPGTAGTEPQKPSNSSKIEEIAERFPTTFPIHKMPNTKHKKTKHKTCQPKIMVEILVHQKCQRW
jgi:hypothetical protein